MTAKPSATAARIAERLGDAIAMRQGLLVESKASVSFIDDKDNRRGRPQGVPPFIAGAAHPWTARPAFPGEYLTAPAVQRLRGDNDIKAITKLVPHPQRHAGLNVHVHVGVNTTERFL